jgi:hypothetical protein
MVLATTDKQYISLQCAVLQNGKLVQAEQQDQAAYM